MSTALIVISAILAVANIVMYFWYREELGFAYEVVREAINENKPKIAELIAKQVSDKVSKTVDYKRIEESLKVMLIEALEEDYLDDEEDA